MKGRRKERERKMQRRGGTPIHISGYAIGCPTNGIIMSSSIPESLPVAFVPMPPRPVPHKYLTVSILTLQLHYTAVTNWTVHSRQRKNETSQNLVVINYNGVFVNITISNNRPQKNGNSIQHCQYNPHDYIKLSTSQSIGKRPLRQSGQIVTQPTWQQLLQL